MVLYLDRAAPFFRLSNGFLPECRASRTQGGGVIPVGWAVSSYKNPGQPAALRRLAAGREEEEHKK
jgi:hypothetical protein